MRDRANSPSILNKKEKVYRGRDIAPSRLRSPIVKRIVLGKSLDPDRAKPGRLYWKRGACERRPWKQEHRCHGIVAFETPERKRKHRRKAFQRGKADKCFSACGRE